MAYEADASGLDLVPDLVARPEFIDEVIELVRKAGSDRTPIRAEQSESQPRRGYCSRQISMMTAMKRELDPHGILAPGNIL